MMQGRLFRFSLVAVFCQLCFATISWPSEFGSGAGKNWPLVSGDTSNQRYSSLDRINLRTVQSLSGAWKSAPFQDGASSRSTPVVHDGVMFVNAGARVYALNAENGSVVWSWQPDKRQAEGLILTLRAGFGVPNYQGVAIGNGAVFVGLMDGRVAALNEKTGDVLWMRQIGDEPRRIGQAVSAAPTYADGIVFAGLANGDFGLRGRVVALDAKTGKDLWQFYTVPGLGESGHETWDKDNDTWKIGGGGVWQVGTVDKELGTAYFAVGNTTPSWGGELRAGDNLYTSSVIALDLKTGRKKWHFQAIHHDIWDADVATAPVLYEVKKDGKNRKGVAIIRSDGYVFMLDRETGQPLVPIEERPVPQNVQSKSAKTQPFPVGADGLLPDCSFWTDKIPAGFVCEAAFTPPSWPPPSQDPPNVLAPMWGVRNTPMSYSPQTGLLYARGTASLDWRRRAEDPYYWQFIGFVPDLKTYGFLAAFDSRSSKIVWKHEMRPETLGQGGSITTAGGLMFRLGGDGEFTAYNAKTGDSVWQFQTGYRGGSGSPSTYEVNGTQYIAVPVGPVIWGFKLNGSLREMASSTPVPSPYGDFSESGAFQNTDRIETTKLQSDAGGLGGIRYYLDPYSFDPTRARVKAGTTVTFGNRGQETYTIVARDGSWTTGPIPVTEERKIRFDKPGLYTYVSKEHPWSYGQLMVVGDAIAKDGVYSSEQASRGQKLYTVNCASCHLDTLEGNGQAASLVGLTFGEHWNNRTFTELYARISTTMPQKSPGSLTPDAYLEILSYLLQANNFPAGAEPLKSDSMKFRSAIGDSRPH
jgi:quinohemoprotein ethanol dehydrogenase